MNAKSISILIADDYPILLKGLFEALNSKDYTIVGQASNGIQALETLIKYNPTIAILDIEMPLLNGFEVVKMAKEKGLTTKFIIQSFHKEESIVMQAIAIQINGFLVKEDDFAEVEKCIKAVIDNEHYYSPSLNSNLLSTLKNNLFGLKLLTSSELTILKLISQQHSTNAIAENFNVSNRTIEKHRSNIIKKINIEGTTKSLSNWAIEKNKIIMDL